MHNTTTNNSRIETQTNQVSNITEMHSSQLLKIFMDELKNIYWAEKALTRVMPKMITNALLEELIAELKRHLIETTEQVSRIERIFEMLKKRLVNVKYDAMAGLIAEVEEIMDEYDEGAMCDAGIISVAQKVEHYEIASYGTLCQFAKTLGITEALTLLETTLQEQKAANKKLAEIALMAINIEIPVVVAKKDVKKQVMHKTKYNSMSFG